MACSAVSSLFKTIALPLKCSALFAGDFGHRAFLGQVAAQDDNVAAGFDRVVQRMDDLLALRIRLNAFQRFRHRLAGDSQRIAVEQTFLQQHLHQGPNAADGDQFGHEILPARLEIGQHGNAAADAREVVEQEFDLGGVRDGEQMQNGVGRTAQGDRRR